ncbi:unnamed protein product [Effrenium voratum]|nr:unnamed protein product [Effrenium voratum]
MSNGGSSGSSLQMIHTPSGKSRLEAIRASFARGSFLKRQEGSTVELVKGCGSGTAQENYIWDQERDVLGQGVTGIVFKARPRHSPEACCVVKQSVRQTDLPLKAILAEFEHASALCHPNILQVREYFVDSLNVYVIAEWAEGGELSSVLREAREQRFSLSRRWVAAVATQLLRALRHCHDKHQLVHADVKPDNVLLLEKGSIKEPKGQWVEPVVLLADFGNAQRGVSDAGMITIPMGDPRYAAPELHEARCFVHPYEPLRLDRRFLYATDIWMLGATVYELLFLELPFLGAFEGSHSEFLEKSCAIGASRTLMRDLRDKVFPSARRSKGHPKRRWNCSGSCWICRIRRGQSGRRGAPGALAGEGGLGAAAAQPRPGPGYAEERPKLRHKAAVHNTGGARHASDLCKGGERDLLESFRSLDTEGLGEVTLEELQHGLLQAVPTWTARELSQVIAYVSRGGQDRVITFRRFVACCLDLEEPAVAERLRIIFHRFPRRGLEIRASWPDSGPSGFFESWAQGASVQQADTEKVEDLATRSCRRS